MDDYGWLMREVLFLAVFTFCCFWEEWTMSNPDSWRLGHMISCDDFVKINEGVMIDCDDFEKWMR